MNVTKDIYYVGVNDHQVDLFEGQYDVPNGMAYNSYVIMDEKIAIMDSVDKDFASEWINNIKEILKGKSPSYIIIQHMEPDHSGSLKTFMEEFKDTVIVSSSKAFVMMKNFIDEEFEERRIVVSENSLLNLGKHTLRFISAPMVHWPEVIVTYDELDKVLFSADGFGKFGALDVEDEWACEARRYYFGIVGKYGAQVQALLKKASNLDIQTICPLHGPVLTGDLTPYLEAYNTWSSYEPEEPEAIFLAYASIHVNTEAAAHVMAEKLRQKGANVTECNLATADVSVAVASAFSCGKMILACATYDGFMFPPMEEFLTHLKTKNFQKRTVGLIENGTWAPMAAKFMSAKLEEMKNITICESKVSIKSALNAESEAQMDAFVEDLLK